MRAHRNDAGALVIEHRPAWVIAFTLPASLTLVIYSLVEVARLGVESRDVWGSLLAAVMIFVVGSWAGTLWTVTIDSASATLRWRKSSPLGKRTGAIPFTDIAAVTLGAQRCGPNQNRRRPRVALLIQRHYAEPFRVSQHAAATPVARANLAVIATLLRAEVGIPEPDEGATLIDRIEAAPSRVAAIKDVKERLGVSLRHAKSLVDAARHRETHPRR